MDVFEYLNMYLIDVIRRYMISIGNFQENDN